MIFPYSAHWNLICYACSLPVSKVGNYVESTGRYEKCKAWREEELIFHLFGETSKDEKKRIEQSESHNQEPLDDYGQANLADIWVKPMEKRKPAS